MKVNRQSQCEPVFIVGSGRSGTSLLTWCLGQHPNILPLPETHWIARLTINMRKLYEVGAVHGRFSHLGALDWDEADFYASFGRSVDQFVIDTIDARLRFIRKLSAKKKGLSESDIENLEKEGKLSPDPDLVTPKNYQVVRSVSDPKRRWVDGTPENVFYMYSLSLLFPGARFIHLLRDPNEVARSLMKFSQAGSAGENHDEAKAYEHWLKHVEYAIKGEKALGWDKVLRIDYIDFINSSESTLRSCFGFLGEEFNPDCLLPLKEKINSSKIDEPLASFKPKSRESKRANDYYQSILNQSPGDPDQVELQGLQQHFENYAADINKA
ncbi:MAG: sulfotransferase [Syntrophales bacterium]|nr:sulfotransferase [Syntrophales bacterium]